MEKKAGLHKAYFVFFGICLMMAGGMGLVLNVVGNFFAPIAQQAFGMDVIGVKPDGTDLLAFEPHMTEVTLIMTVYSYVMFFWLPFAGRLFGKVDGRILFGVAGIVCALSTALMGLYPNTVDNHNMLLFYASAVGWGLAGPILWLVGPSVLINNWFAPHKAGKMLGIASAFTGVGAFCWSPLFGYIINPVARGGSGIGYQTGFLIEAALVVILIVLPAIFLFRTHPKDLGLKPCGADDPQEVKDKVKVDSLGGLGPKAALATAAFYLIFIAACIISLGGGYKSTMPTMVAQTFPDITAVGALLISAAAVGNVLGKIFLGFAVDKIGIVAALVVFVVLAMIGFICLAFSGGTEAILLVGAFGIGTSDALMSVGLPLTTRTVFGLKHYAKIYSFLNMGIAVLGGLGAVMVTTLANNIFVSNYQPGYLIGLGGFVIVGTCLVLALINAKSFRKKWEDD
ncbi:MAG: MFS transporter [Coriobacteriales bacterium]|jgi:MFS family permease|nr:MFS transporter [Coriobacteriales bacterium]